MQQRVRFSGIVILMAGLLGSSEVLSQSVQTGPRPCDITGAWYGGSVVAYHMTVIPASPAGHYVVYAEGMYKNSVINTIFTGKVEKKGEKYVGSLMQLTTNDPDFLNPPPIGKLPDLSAVWSQTEMVDCNTIKNTIPFFGIYFAGSLWEPGIVWNPDRKIPMLDAPDVDLLDVITGGAPVVESYHRLVEGVNPKLLHQD
jgi:hypothetical protein